MSVDQKQRGAHRTPETDRAPHRHNQTSGPDHGPGSPPYGTGLAESEGVRRHFPGSKIFVFKGGYLLIFVFKGVTYYLLA
jgi:hypothetical protein